MSGANVARQFGVFQVGADNRLREVHAHWSYGQAMNTASVQAERFPDRIVFIQTRVVIQESWEEPDFEREEAVLAEKAARQAEEKQ